MLTAAMYYNEPVGTLVQGKDVSAQHSYYSTGSNSKTGTLTVKKMKRDRLSFHKGVQGLFSSWSCHTGLTV